MNPDQIKILVVDDDAEVAHGTAHLLKQAGYATAQAANGVEALQAVQSFRPNLVLTDREMPEMDGMEFCRRMKSNPAFSDVFVILISGSYTLSEEQSAGLEAGADGYIARPIANRELVARVAVFARILRLNRALHEKNAELEEALANVKTLSGLVPICAHCKKVRDDRGYWSMVEDYVTAHSDAKFSHGLCPDCLPRYFPNMPADQSLDAP